MPDNTPRLALTTFADGEEPWDHTDTVEALDKLAVDRGPIADRPATGAYDDALYLAVDQRILWRWDDTAGDWEAVAGLGTASDPVPGTSHYESFRTENSFTDAAGVTHTGELADIDDVGEGGGGGDIATVTVASSSSSFAADFVCDGTDDHTTINNAIADLPADGGAVVLTAGTFNLSGAVTADVQALHLAGQGYGTHLRLANGTNTDNITVSAANVEISQLRIDGNKTNQSDGGNNNNQIGINFASSPDCHIHNCWILNTQYANIRADAGGDRARIHDNYCDGTGSGSQVARDNISLSDPGTNRSIVANNTCLNAADHGIEASNTNNVVIDGNFVQNTGLSCINPHDGVGNAVTGNVCMDAGTDGIAPGQMSDSTIVGNRIINPGDDGMQPIQDNCTVVGNTVVGATSNGIVVGGSGNVVGMNMVRGSGTTDVVDNGSSNMIRWNQTSDGSGTGVYVQSTTPNNPSTNDIWFDTT